MAEKKKAFGENSPGQQLLKWLLGEEMPPTQPFGSSNGNGTEKQPKFKKK